jgi:hypothetical protein
MDVLVRMPSGVRLRFKTDSARVGIDFHATNMVTPPAVRRPITFSLEAAGQLTHGESNKGNTIELDRNAPGKFELTRGESDRILFDNPAGETETLSLWLPHNAFLELRSLVLEDGASLSPPDPETRRRWWHYGSSISHCMEATYPAEVWPAVAARHADLALTSLGFGGQCHLDQFIARTLRDSDADVISLKIGINIINGDTMRERVFTPALHGFLDTIREGKPDVPIVLISPIFCPSAENHPGPTVPNDHGKFVTLTGHDEIRDGCLTLVRVRQIISNLVHDRREAGDSALTYLDGLDLFGAADADGLPDDLHPGPDGYILMGERAAPSLRKAAVSATP